MTKEKSYLLTLVDDVRQAQRDGATASCEVFELEVLPYGFRWGPAAVERLHSDKKKGWVCLGIRTPKSGQSYALQIYVSRTGRSVRVFCADGKELR